VNRSILFLLCGATALSLGACSEEYYGLLQCPDGLDTLLVYPRPAFQQMAVIGDESGMAGMGSLYLGSSGETRSDVLLKYDFSSFREDHPDFPDSLFDPAIITSARLRLARLRKFRSDSDLAGNQGIVFEVRALEAGYDPQNYISPPGLAVSLEGRILNQDSSELNHDDDPLFEIDAQDLISWVLNREAVDMVITAAEGSDPVLIGIASSETLPLQVSPYHWQGDTAPTLIVNFGGLGLGQLHIIPTHDTSTFHQVAGLPPDMAHLQTGLNSFPVLTFDIPPLPAGSSSYVLYDFRVYADYVDSMWTDSQLGVSRLDPGVLEEMPEPVLASALEASSTRMFRLGPDNGVEGTPTRYGRVDRVQWDPAPPRVMHLMLNLSGNYGLIGGPEIYFTQSTFFGPGAEIQLRPVLYLMTCNPRE